MKSPKTLVKSKQATKSQPRSRVLITIPTLGERLDLLEETLESIKAQGKNAIDIVVVCPKKSTAAIKLAKKFGADIADDPGGLSAAVNVGMATAKPHHEYLCWMGDDDLLRPGALKKTMAALDANPEAVLAFGYCDYIDDKSHRIFTSRAGSLAPWIMTWGPNLVPLPGMLYRRTSLEQAGEFDPKLKYAMDLDVLLRLRKLGKFINVKETVGAFRWHPTSTTVANRNASLRETEMVKRRHLPALLRPFSALWEVPVRIATRAASRRVNKMAHK